MTTQSSYRTETVHSRRWVWHNDILLGAITVNPYRTHVFPFFAPCGANVVQECGADHVHHQGIMVGQDLVNDHNFWAMMHPQYPRNKQVLVNEKTNIGDDGVTFVFTLDWTTAAGQAIVREERTMRLRHHHQCHEAWVQSKLVAEFGPVDFGITKEGGIGMRVHPLLETEMGGVIIDAEGRRGAEAIFDQPARWIDVSGSVEGRNAGILMAPPASEPSLPWFVRDYGVHLHSPRRHAALHLAAGEATSSAVLFLAHDGRGDAAKLSAMLDGIEKQEASA